MLYSLTFAIPIFVARVIPNMTATQTGMLFMPGSLITAAFMLPVGMLSSRVNPKLLALIGIVVGELSVLSMTHFTTDTGPMQSSCR